MIRTDQETLAQYSQAYEHLVRLCIDMRSGEPETLLQLVEAAALYASAHHPGRFGDGALENLALEVGRRVADVPLEHLATRLNRALAPSRRGSRRRVLHVSPFVWRVGGHTRTLLNWTALDDVSQHSLVLTHDTDPTLLPTLQRQIERNGGELLVLPKSMGLVEKALALRAVARSFADLIVLHHSCNDIIPLVAFAVPDLPPVALVNDCDQAFWIGSPAIDAIVHQREAGARLAHRRFTRNHAVLPIPLTEPLDMPSRQAARAALGIHPDDLVMLTVGRAIKYRPSSSHDFFRSVRAVLEREPRARLFVVGVTEQEAAEWRLDFRHPRVQLCGPISDLAAHRAATDLYLESMPFGSATALMESALLGIPVVLPYAPPYELFVTNHGLEAIVANPRDEAEYVERVVSLLGDRSERQAIGLRLREHMLANHTGEGWVRRLDDVYRAVEHLTHDPQSIPAASCMATPLDVALSEWHAALDDAARSGAPSDAVARIILQAAVEAKGRGDYSGASTILWRYVRLFGVDATAMRVAATLPLRRIHRWWRHARVRTA